MTGLHEPGDDLPESRAAAGRRLRAKYRRGGSLSVQQAWAEYQAEERESEDRSTRKRLAPDPPPCWTGPVLIRAETEADHDVVLAVNRLAFGDHGDQVVAIVEGLRAQGALSWVAEVDGVVVGHTMVGRNLLDAPKQLVDVGVLSPLAVRPDHQRQGIGKALVAAAVAGSGQYPALFLEGDPDYYGPLGFRAGGELGFRRPSLRIPPAAFQVWLLPGYEEWMTGTLVYDRLFWDLDAVGLR